MMPARMTQNHVPSGKPHVPLVVDHVDGMAHVGDVARPVDHRPARAQGTVDLVREDDVAPVVVGTGVDVNAVEVDVRNEFVDHRPVPVAPAVVAAGNQLDGRIDAAKRQSPLLRLLHISLDAEVADLELAPQLVAESPVPHGVGLLATVVATTVGPVGVQVAVAVLNPGHRLLEGSRAHVEADIGLGAEELAVGHELVGSEPVRFDRAPGRSNRCGRASFGPMPSCQW
jgi:hypothetical protein